MNPNIVPSAVLTCHPSTPCDAIRFFGVSVRRNHGELSLAYFFEGDLDAVCIPNPGTPHQADGLWQNTCLEAFLKGRGEWYYEFNFAPSMAWAAYRFMAYRQGMAALDTIKPVKIAVRRDAHLLELDALINLGGVPMTGEGNLYLGLSAIIKEIHGGVSYWALTHPKGKPDFHHTDSFAFALVPDREG